MLVSFNKTRTKIERCQERQKAPPCCRVPSLPGCRWFTLHFRHVILQLAATQKRRDGARTLHSSDLGFPAWEAYRFWGHLTGHLTRTTEAGPSCRGRSQPSSRSVTPRARPPRPILSKRMRRKAVVAQRAGLVASSTRRRLRLRWGTDLDELAKREIAGGKARGVHLIETNDHRIPVLALGDRCHRAALLVPVRPSALGEQLRSARVR